MNAEIIRANANRSLAIDDSRHPEVFSKGGFLIVLGHASAGISVQPGLAGLWVPVRGDTALSSHGSRVVATRGFVYASDSQRLLTADVGENANCVAILAAQHSWSAALDAWKKTPSQPYSVVPALHSATQSVRRRLFRFIREIIVSGDSPRPNLSLLASSLSELQGDFDTLIRRCPGTSISAKRSVFFRLQRSVNYIMFCDKEPPKVRDLARIANYSMHQFIRVFSAVYGNTPFVYMSRLRAERARQMLVGSDLAVRDIATVMGINSRATFGRMVKNNLGQPATLVRRQARDGASSPTVGASKGTGYDSTTE